MSDAGSESQSGAGRREVAYRAFAAEYDDATYSYSAGEEERAPNYVVTPSGARANRLFLVGVLTEVETVSEGVLRARVVDPTGAFVLYAGQYQPDEQATLEAAEPPTFVAVTGKARTFRPEDADQVFTSVRPESITEVDADTRDRWTVQAAEHTLARIGHVATALSGDARGDALRTTLTDRGVDEGLADGIATALEQYDTTTAYLDALRETAVGAAAVVAGARDSVPELTTAPDAPGGPAPTALADLVAEMPDHVAGAATSEPSDQSATADTTATTTTTTASDREGQTTTSDAHAASEPTEQTDPETTATATTETTETTATATTDEDDDGELSEPTIEADDDPGELGTFDGEFELEEETREEIESEYGTEFQSGTEVDEPGAADIDTPDPETTDHVESSLTESESDQSHATDSEPEPESEPEPTDAPAEAASATTSESDATPDPDAGDADADVEEPDAKSEADADGRLEDPQAALVAILEELDDGSGADRDAVVETMADRHGIGADETDDIIQEALMSGRCYEPDDSSLKPI